MGPRKRLLVRLYFSHLILFLGHTILSDSVKADENSTADQRDLWRWCSTSPPDDLIEDLELRLDPYPIQPGKNITLHLKGNLKQELNDLRLKTVITLNRFLRVTYTRNLCKEQPGLCPLEPRPQEVSVSYAIPSVLVGPIYVDATVSDEMKNTTSSGGNNSGQFPSPLTLGKIYGDFTGYVTLKEAFARPIYDLEYFPLQTGFDNVSTPIQLKVVMRREEETGNDETKQHAYNGTYKMYSHAQNRQRSIKRYSDHPLFQSRR